MKKQRVYYVYNHDFNSDTFKKFNIFGNSYIEESIDKFLKEYTTFEDFKEKMLNIFLYEYSHRCEYEFLCSGLFKNDKSYKFNVYDQIEPNIDLIARYIIDLHNESVRKNKIEL